MIESVCTGFVFGRRPDGTRTVSGPGQTGHILLNSILRRVRQRAFVILDPYVIPRIDPAVARLASEKMISLADVSHVGAFAEYRPAWSRFIE